MPPFAAHPAVSMDLANFFKSLINIHKPSFFKWFSRARRLPSSALLGRGCTKIEHQCCPKNEPCAAILSSVSLVGVEVGDKRVAIETKEKTKPRVCA